MKKPSIFMVGTVSAVFAAIPVYAADPTDDLFTPAGLPAVSGPNGKAAISGGFIDLKNQKSDGRIQGELSFTVPLSFSSGLQIDGSIGDLGGDFTGSFGGHLFTRDPSSYLLGVWGGYAAIGNNDIGRLGPEAELYFGNITIQGTVGWENSDTNGDDFFAYANLALYSQDNAKFYVGFRHTLDRSAGAVGFEWLTSTRLVLDAPMSIFAEGQIGDDKHATAWAGIKFYFGGPDKSLIRRHREDDPDDPTAALNQLAGQCIPIVVVDAASVDNCGNPVKKGPSDIRLKTDIRHLATLPNGLKLYSYEYIWDDDTTYVGVMAQDLLANEATKDAVFTMPNGYYAVDYAKLGLQMITLEEWNRFGQSSMAA